MGAADIKPSKDEPIETHDRNCLKCDKPFTADSAYIRLCKNCRTNVAGISPLAVGVMGE